MKSAMLVLLFDVQVLQKVYVHFLKLQWNATTITVSFFCIAAESVCVHCTAEKLINPYRQFWNLLKFKN